MFKKKIVLACLSGLVMYLAWPPLPTAFLLLIGFVPLLLIHQQLRNEKRRHIRLWCYSYIAMLIFNTGSTWWVWNASPSGCLMMLFANSLIMSLPFWLFSLTNKGLPRTGYLSLVFYYLAVEYIHFNWSASWPWMTLGKGFASIPWFIQWYEFTGEMGGTLLILCSNIWIIKIIRIGNYRKIWQPITGVLLILGFSFLVSKSVNLRTSSGENYAIECVVSQPNIDPYTEKFSSGENYITDEGQLKFALDVARPLITPQTKLLVLPETAITGWNEEGRINESELLVPAREMTNNTGLAVLAGAESINIYEAKVRPSVSARYDSFSSKWWDSYNTALLIKDNRVKNIYHKSRLVPGVEKMPFAFLEQLSINLGGTSGSLGVSSKPINFVPCKGLKIAPLICYESVFGDYVSEFVRDSANALAVITNDGWWGNTPGFKQHLLFGAIRCIETRKEMIRSANTGVSAKIDVFGRISQQTKYNERTAFKCFLEPNNIHTFYVKYGNITGKLSFFFACVLLFCTIGIKWLKKSERR